MNYQLNHMEMYINNLNQLEELDDFSAGIYSNFE